MAIVIRNARVVTLAQGERPRRGKGLGELGVLARGDVLVEEGTVTAVGRVNAPPGARTIDARGRVLMPGFVDCHTHACWAGDRLDEWDQKRNGVPYLQILASGGGIMSTVRAVRRSPREELAAGLRSRLGMMLEQGTTTAEVKSGYGLAIEHELKMLRAIADAAGTWAGTVVPTALLGHAIDTEQAGFVERVVYDGLARVSDEFPGVAVDAYCEKGAWSVDETTLLLTNARAAGHPVRVHADQFNALGMTTRAIELGAVSVDHMEATGEDELRRLAASETFGVMLPICGLHLDGRYGPGRAFVDIGGALCIASNCNPGSAPCSSMPLTIAMAVRHLGLSPAEAIAAATVNPATLLGLSDRGTIVPGQRADLVLLRHTDERMLAYEMGGNPVDVVVCGGKVVRERE